MCPVQALEVHFTPEEMEILAEIARQDEEAPPAAEERSRPRWKSTRWRRPWRRSWPPTVTFGSSSSRPRVVQPRVSWELLGVGATLAEARKVDLCAVVVGHGVEHLCREAFAYGAKKVYLVDAPVFQFYRTESYLQATCYLIDRYKPEIVLMGATGLGRDLAGAVATRLGTGLTADCTGLNVDDKGNLMQTRPAFGGNIMATIMCDKFRPQMATVRAERHGDGRP